MRNKLVAEAFYLTKNIEKYDSGFIRIRRELEAYPEIAFTVEEIGGGLVVTFRQVEGVNEGVSGRIDRLFQTVKQNPGIRLPDLSTRLNVPVKTLERWIKRLRSEKKVVFRGAAKTGSYCIPDGERWCSSPAVISTCPRCHLGVSRE